MEWKNTISFLLVFLIAFSLGYLINFPRIVDINFNLDEEFSSSIENLKNINSCELMRNDIINLIEKEDYREHLINGVYTTDCHGLGNECNIISTFQTDLTNIINGG